MEYTVHEVSQQTGISPYTLRYYDKLGLLPGIRRDANGVRRFTDSDLEWLDLICCLKSAGMPLRQIKTFVCLSHEGDRTLEQRCDLLFAHRDAMQQEIQRLQRLFGVVTGKAQCYQEQLERYRQHGSLVESSGYPASAKISREDCDYDG